MINLAINEIAGEIDEEVYNECGMNMMVDFYPFACRFWKLRHPNYFRLSSQRGARTTRNFSA
jgi:hypothetical protein